MRHCERSSTTQEAVGRGIDLAKAGSHSAALQCYTQAIELCARNCDAHVAAGAAHANLKDYKEALKQFDIALGQCQHSMLIMSSRPSN